MILWICWWYILSCEYLREFFQKILNSPNGILRAKLKCLNVNNFRQFFFSYFELVCKDKTRYLNLEPCLDCSGSSSSAMES